MADEQSGNVLSMRNIIVLMVIMVLVAGVSSYVFISVLMGNNNSQQAAEEQVEQNTGPFYDLGSFTVNLSGTRGFQFIKADIQVQVNDKAVTAELEKRQPQVRDMIITILRSKKLEDIEDPQAEVIKNEIRTKLSQILSEGKVTGVYFTRLVVQ